MIDLSKCIGIKLKTEIKKANYKMPIIRYKPNFDDVDKTYNVNLNGFIVQDKKLLANMAFGSNT